MFRSLVGVDRLDSSPLIASLNEQLCSVSVYLFRDLKWDTCRPSACIPVIQYGCRLVTSCREQSTFVVINFTTMFALPSILDSDILVPS